MSVAVVRSLNRLEGVKRALSLIESEVVEAVKGRTRFLVKPNFVSTVEYSAVTPIETVEALLDFIYSRFSVSEVVVAESPAVGTMSEAVRSFGYSRLRSRYGVEFVDLDDYDQQRFELKDEHGDVFEVYVSRLLLDKSFVKISPCRAKTHDVVVVTLTIKNVVMGAIKRGYKHEMHKGYLAINYNIAKLATHLMPDLGVVDGVEAMEGDGPVAGSLRKWGAVFASTNPVNLDSVVAYAMGFNPGDIGYLYFLSLWGYGEVDMGKIRVVGDGLESVRTKLRPHSMYGAQLSWRKNLGKLSRLT